MAETPEIVGTEETEETEIAGTVAETPEIVGREETEEDEIAGEESEVIGFSWKKFRKAFKKIAPVAIFPPLALARVKKLRQAAKYISPYAAFETIRLARKKPAYRAKVEAIKNAAEASPEELQTRMKDEGGQPSSFEDAMGAKQKAREAYENLQKASAIQQQAFEETGDYDRYDPPQEGEPDDERIEGEPSLYEWGAMAGMHDLAEDVVGFSFKSALRKLGRTIDPSRTGSPFRAALTAIPGIGPQLTAAADMVAKAKGGSTSAQQKIEDLKKLAAAGDPRAKEALANLLAANSLAPSHKLGRFFSTYEFGARTQV